MSTEQFIVKIAFLQVTSFLPKVLWRLSPEWLEVPCEPGRGITRHRLRLQAQTPHGRESLSKWLVSWLIPESNKKAAFFPSGGFAAYPLCVRRCTRPRVCSVSTVSCPHICLNRRSLFSLDSDRDECGERLQHGGDIGRFNSIHESGLTHFLQAEKIGFESRFRLLECLSICFLICKGEIVSGARIITGRGHVQPSAYFCVTLA